MKNNISIMMEEFYKLFHETEGLMLKQDIRCLTLSEIHVIETLNDKVCFMNEIAKDLGVTMGTATVSVNKLVDKGFILREQSSEDRRKITVKLSKKGFLALESHYKFHKLIIKKITKDLCAEDIAHFTGIFKKLELSLKEELENNNPKSLADFEKNSLVKITGVSGTRGLREFFSKKGIFLGTLVKILEINENFIGISVEDKIIELDLKDSLNLLGVMER